MHTKRKEDELGLEDVRHLATGVVVGFQLVALCHKFIPSRELKKPLRQMMPMLPSFHSASSLQMLRRRYRRGLAESYEADIRKTQQNLEKYSGIERVFAEAFINAEHHRMP